MLFLGAKCFMVHLGPGPGSHRPHARVEIASQRQQNGPDGKFYVAGQEYIRGDCFSPQELVLSVEIPNPGAMSKGVYLKLKERQSFDFAIVSVAVSLSLKNNIVDQARIAFGGLAPYPMRAVKAEAALKGKGIKDALSAACKAATDGAQPLGHNRYKVDAAKGILEEALVQLA